MKPHVSPTPAERLRMMQEHAARAEARLATMPRAFVSPNACISTEAAAAGFYALGYRVERRFPRPDEIDPEAPFAGGIPELRIALAEAGRGLPHLDCYPEALREFLRRPILKSTVARASAAIADGGRLFVKPVRTKATGAAVYDDASTFALATMHLEPDEPVYVGTPVTFLSEWRVYVHRGEIVGWAPYKGDPLLVPPVPAVRDLVAAWPDAPIAYGLDVGMMQEVDDDDGHPILGLWRTVVVEVNDAWALGVYGCREDRYASMLADRWREMLTAPESRNPLKSSGEVPA